MIHLPHSPIEGLDFYTIFNLAAIMTGIVGAWIAAQKSKFPTRDFALIVSSGLLMVILGGKLVMLDRWEWLSLFNEGTLPLYHGKSVVGAIVGGIVGAWGVSLFLGNKRSILALCAVSFPLALAVQRMGCLFAGCCHGVVSSVPWGITYGPGSKPFLHQQQMGLIPDDAMSSLAMHPNQLYNIVACVIIAIIAWKTGHRWKTSSGKFFFSVILYLSFRFVDEFFRFHVQPEEWMGLELMQWKIMVIVLTLSVFLYLRERSVINTPVIIKSLGFGQGVQYGFKSESLVKAGNRKLVHTLKILAIAMIVLTIVFHIGGWLNADERILILVGVLPLCVIALAFVAFQWMRAMKIMKSGALITLALVLMSQKADTPTIEIPKSYTSFDGQSGFGQFANVHEFNYGPKQDCDGNTYYGSDPVPYKHTYNILGGGVNRKIYYNQFESLMLSLHVFRGRETEAPLDTFSTATYHNTLWSINPKLQYDTKSIGLGIGGTFGMLGHDVSDDPDDHKDYNPNTDVRTASLQYRLRLFNEQKFFTEVLGGWDLGSVGDHNIQWLIGSRFNGHKLMLKAGPTWSKHGNNGFVFHGEIALSPRFYLTPQIILQGTHNEDPFGTKGNRMSLGIEYRINDKK